jgi:hypothetical protein
MAEVITVQRTDTISRILIIKRGLQPHQIHEWITRLRPLNPHIGNLDRIYPGERVLIPDVLNESIDANQIWQNVFGHIPPALKQPHTGHRELFFTIPGISLDSIADNMFAQSPHGNLSLSTRRAVLFHNNPVLRLYPCAGALPGGMFLDITPQKLSGIDIHCWSMEHNFFAGYLQELHPMTQEMYQQVGPRDAYLLARMVQSLKDAGISVGGGDVVRGISYGLGGVSGLAASGGMAVGTIDTLVRQIYTDAVKTFGAKMVVSKQKNQLLRLTRFIKNHPNYNQLMRSFKELPEFLLPGPRNKIVPPGASQINNHLARHFRKQYFQAFRHWSSDKYLPTIARQLRGRVKLFKGIGRGATWYVPAVIGLYNVAEAPPQTRMRTLFEEGFGIVGGAFGTWTGGTLLTSGAIGLFTLCGLCMGPAGIFVVVFLFATAGGIAGNELAKRIGSAIYDYGEHLEEGVFYHSSDQLLEAIK